MSIMRDRTQSFESSAPPRRIKVLIIVIALHVVIGYALLSGMAKKEVAAVNKPLQAMVIQEVIIAPSPAPAQPPLQKPEAPKPKPATVTTPLPIPHEPVMQAMTQVPSPLPTANAERW